MTFATIAMAAGGLAVDPVPLLLALGSVASATRCFGWEAANIWTLEVFPTEVQWFSTFFPFLGGDFFWDFWPAFLCSLPETPLPSYRTVNGCSTV